MIYGMKSSLSKSNTEAAVRPPQSKTVPESVGQEIKTVDTNSTILKMESSSCAEACYIEASYGQSRP